MASHKGTKKQKLTLYNVFILMFIGLGSLTYGYTASIIGTTLGQLPSWIALFDVTELTIKKANQPL